MLKRFENLGTALSRNESKKIVGGDAAYELVVAPEVGEEGGYGTCIEALQSCLPLFGTGDCCNGGVCTAHNGGGYHCCFH